MLYILKFERPLGHSKSRYAQARYYVGWCADGGLHRRLREHRAGRGAAITRAAVERGIQIELVATLPGADRNEERRVKNWKNTPKLVQRLKAGRLAGWQLAGVA